MVDEGNRRGSRGLTSEAIREGWRLATRPVVKALSRYVPAARVKPWWTIIDVTDRCLLRCPTCAKWQVKPQGAELSAEEWKQVIRSLREWLGPHHLSFTGGEPLLRQDLPELVEFASTLGLSTNLMTNGHLLDESLSRKLIDAGLRSISLSMNGLTPEIHDRSRGQPGSHAKVMAALDQWLKMPRRPPVGLSVIATGENLPELARLLRWALETDVDGVVIQPILANGAFQAHEGAPARYDPAQVRNSSLWPEDPVRLSSVFRELVAMKRRGYPLFNSEKHLMAMRDYFNNTEKRPAPGCPAGSDNVLVDPYGKLRLCNLMDPLGDLRGNRPSDLWSSRRAKEQRQAIMRCALPCWLLTCNAEVSPTELARLAIRRLGGSFR